MGVRDHAFERLSDSRRRMGRRPRRIPDRSTATPASGDRAHDPDAAGWRRQSRRRSLRGSAERRVAGPSRSWVLPT